MPRRILVLYAHPQPRRSIANRRLAEAAGRVENVTLVDLYAEYPALDIDVPREQARLDSHDVIVFQHPVFWYSSPAILKEWQDLVLEYGYAYGHHGRALEGKILLNAVTTGGAEPAYSVSGINHFDLRELFRPFEQTANLCRMVYLPPFVLFGARRNATGEGIELHAARYRALLEALRDDTLDIETARAKRVLNEALGAP